MGKDSFPRRAVPAWLAAWANQYYPQAADRSPWDLLIVEVYPIANRLIVNRGRRHQIDPVDLAHDVFLILRRRTRRIAPEDVIKYAAGIARCLLIEYMRRRANNFVALDFEIESSDEVATQMVQVADLIRMVARDEQQGEIASAHYVENWSVGEISAYFGLHPRKVYRELVDFRGRAEVALRDEIECR